MRRISLHGCSNILAIFLNQGLRWLFKNIFIVKK